MSFVTKDYLRRAAPLVQLPNLRVQAPELLLLPLRRASAIVKSGTLRQSFNANGALQKRECRSDRGRITLHLSGGVGMRNKTWTIVALAMFSGGAGYAQTTFTQPIKIANNAGVPVAVNLTKDGSNYLGKASWTGVNCVATPAFLTILNGGYCSATYPWNVSSSYRVCAVLPSQAILNGPSGPYLNCSDALANGITTIELGTGGSSASGVNYDISMIPQQPGTDQMPCNDPQWSGVPFVASNALSSSNPSDPNYVAGGPYYYSQLKPGQIPGVTSQPTKTKTFCSGMTRVPYNFGVTLSCSGHKTFSCSGNATLGDGFPANCGWTQAQFSANPSAHPNCSGNSATCYQAFWWPMSQGGTSGPNALTGGGIYYGGYNSPSQPQDNCTASSGPNPALNITFLPGKPAIAFFR